MAGDQKDDRLLVFRTPAYLRQEAHRRRRVGECGQTRIVQSCNKESGGNADRFRHVIMLDALALRPDAVALGKELTGGLGFDAVVDAVGLPVTRQSGVLAARPGGHVVFTGLHVDETSLPCNTIVRSETNIHGAFCYTQNNFAAAVRLIGDGIVPTDVDWLTIRPLEEADASFAQLIDQPSTVTKVVLQP